jgi:hypothetical protein
LSGVVFLVCLELPGEPPDGLRRRLAAWRALRCFDQCWMIGANTTSRVVYDSLAEEVDDRARILVCELDGEAVWFNLRGAPDLREVLHRA